MKHPSDSPEVSDIDNLSYYHAPTEDQVRRMKEIADACKNMLEVIFKNCPSCADRTTAIRDVRSARMWANAAIALEPKE